ncbi:hypothetical protein [Nocardia wallacei]|uniref:hypothetical protein n=1 Tax=Nocardia wallacei TaxID=480035 RepID=UPI002454E6F6|nr:hypothetical protein [Nocardia wallacei]
MSERHIPNGTVYLDGGEPGHLDLLCTLDRAEGWFDDRPAGSRTYRSGRVETWDLDHAWQLLDIGRRNAWIMWDGLYLRIISVHIGSALAEIWCSQGSRSGAALIDGEPAYLTLVEPSPPRPTGEWLPAERARAIRDLVAETIGPDARPAVLAPDSSNGTLTEFNPWAAEFTEARR